MYTAYARDCIVVRSGGDIATGVIQKLWRSGFRVAVLETAEPLTIRRSVALSSAVRKGVWVVEDMRAVLAPDIASCRTAWGFNSIPVLVDPGMKSLAALRPAVLIDAIIAKKNIGMRPSLAPITIALGPGFSAPQDVDCVIETCRGHYLGRLITDGSALPNTGVPGLLGGKSAERVVHAPAGGLVRHVRGLGDAVAENEVLFTIDGEPVRSRIAGTLRGLIEEGTRVRKGLKCADIDPRPAREVDCLTISDKARTLGGAVLEACFMLAARKGLAFGPRQRGVTATQQSLHFEKLPHVV